MSNNNFEIELGQLLASISYILDVSENRYFGHSKRTAYISYCIGKEMKLNNEELADIYYASLIHDIGMSGQMTRYSISEIHFNEELKKAHCELGYDIIKTLPLNSKIAEYILFHHEKWDGTGVFKIKGYQIPLVSQIIHIADFFELFFLRKYGKIGSNKGIVKEWLNTYKNKMFSKDLINVFYLVMGKEKFWLDLLPENILQVSKLIMPKRNLLVDTNGLKQISEAFSILIDSKSKFTNKHSRGVSKITKRFASYLGYSPLMVNKLEIAANLHDIGKFVIPNDILEKPGKLTSEEFDIIKSHSYYTKIALKQVEGLEDIAEWAGNHHEKLNGKGYPEKLNADTLTKEDQVIAIADIYQALTENRSYRKGMGKKETIKIMDEMTRNGHISRELFLDFKQVAL